MKRNFALIAMTGLAVGPASASDYFVYNGDFAGYGGLACERNTQVSDARNYDNFVLSEPTRVRGLWGNYLVTGLTSVQAYWEIRQGAGTRPWAP